MTSGAWNKEWEWPSDLTSGETDKIAGVGKKKREKLSDSTAGAATSTAGTKNI